MMASHRTNARTALSALALLLSGAALAWPAEANGAAFQVQGIFQFGPAHIGIAFTDSVDIAQALRKSNYTLTPSGGATPLAIQYVTLQENQRTVTLVTTAALPASATYDVAVAGVTSRHGAPLDPGGATSFTTVAETVIGIADVHSRINDLIGQTVTIVGQVYMTAGSIGPTGTPSGYIQDGTGRGLNIFGSPLQPAADDLGTVSKCTGTVVLFSSTVVELTPFTATAIASGMPRLAPKVLTVAQASSPQWEGTYIQVTATMTGPPTVSGNYHKNYPATDGGIQFGFRVRNSLGLDPSQFGLGDVVTGSGAGSVFFGTYQATVGTVGEFYKGLGPGDTTPPVLVSAAGVGGETSVTVEFSEPVGAGGSAKANYAVYPTADPGAPIQISTASVSGSTVTLALETPLSGGEDYTVAVNNVQDSSGNPIPAGSTLSFTAAIPVPHQASGVFQFGADYIGVGFTKPVNAGEATQASHYTFTPPLAIASVALQDNGQTVILKTAALLPGGASFSVGVSDVSSATGEPLPQGQDFELQIATESVIDIATLQANPAAYDGQIVTLVGQVTIPVGSSGGTPSGYFQDGSGRGVNLFGGSVQGPVNALGSVAKVTGTVDLYFTTTEIIDYTATLIAAGQPQLGAKVLTPAQAGSPAWEGTYIETSATLSGIAPSGTSAYNYTAEEGGASVTFRIGNGVGIPPDQFLVGDRVTGRGAGGAFQSTFEIIVGNKSDFFLAGSGGPDVTPPTLSSVSGVTGSAIVNVAFSERVRSNEATLVSSYKVCLASDTTVAFQINQVVMLASGRAVELHLAAPLGPRTVFRVQVTDVPDLAGNFIAPGSAATFETLEPAPPAARLKVPATTLIKNMKRQGEVFRFDIGGVLNSRAVCRVFDLQGRLVKVLLDQKITGQAWTTLSWDGRDETFEFVPAGLYIVHLQTTDLNGNVSEDRAPVVVAVRLH